MTDDTPEFVGLNYGGKMGYAYHPNRDIWVAYTPDTAKRIDPPEDIDLNWHGDTFTASYTESF